MTYRVCYWNERDLEWRGTGSNNLPDLDIARTRMRAMAEQCNHCVSFRIEEEYDYLSDLTDEEYAEATCPI